MKHGFRTRPGPDTARLGSPARPLLNLVVHLFYVLALVGCASAPIEASWKQQQTSALREQLIQLDKSVESDEAARLASTAVETAAELAVEYRAVRPACLQNILVNSGKRKRGLCYQWANDLYPHLYDLNLKTLELHLAVARMDTRREHNSVVVTARSQPFEQGIALDAWRHSGRLCSHFVAKDKYPWKPLPRDRVAPELEKYMSQ